MAEKQSWVGAGGRTYTWADPCTCKPGEPVCGPEDMHLAVGQTIPRIGSTLAPLLAVSADAVQRDAFYTRALEETAYEGRHRGGEEEG